MSRCHVNSIFDSDSESETQEPEWKRVGPTVGASGFHSDVAAG